MHCGLCYPCEFPLFSKGAKGALSPLHSPNAGCLLYESHWGQDKMAVIPQTKLSNIFFNENVWISIKISLKFVPMGPVNNIPGLV